MPYRITLKNYRCFAAPVTIDISNDFIAFVGPNNSGKSALIRFPLEFRDLVSQLGQAQAVYNAMRASSQGLGQLKHVLDRDEVFSNLNNNGIEITLECCADTIDAANMKAVVFIDRTNMSWRMEFWFQGARVLAETVGSMTGPIITLQNEIKIDITEFLVLGQMLGNSLYIGPFRNIINVGANEDYYDIQIGDRFIRDFRGRKTGAHKISGQNIAKLVEDIRRIFEYDQLSIEPSADDKTLHITANDKPYKQHELGAGLSQFIVVLANVAIKRPKLILIDEPELNLHPRLQLDFLTTLASYGADSVWFSTHGIGLARSAADRVYAVQRRRDGDSIIRPLEGAVRIAEFLGEMSFSSQKELGFDQIFLVEGPTEVKVFQQWLRAMRKDHQIVVLPLYGRFPDAEEFQEVLRISTKVSAIIDSERTAAGQPLSSHRQGFLDLCFANGLCARALQYRATENYFPDWVVKQVFGQQFRGLGPYEEFDGVNPRWSKSENWKLAAAWPFNEVTDTDLGAFLTGL